MTAVDRSIRRFLLAHVTDGANVLDVGSGGGWGVFLVARERPACVMHGVDPDAKKVQKTNNKLRRLRRKTGARCYRCAAENLSKFFRSSRYDVAVSVHALHHYDDQLSALRNIRTILRPGGRALIAEFDPLYGEKLDDCPRFSLEKICWLCEDAGLTVVSTARKRPGVFLVVAERGR